MKKKKVVFAEKIPKEPKEEKFPAQDLDENGQMLEKAAYEVGLNRMRDHHSADESTQWVEAEKQADAELN